MQWGVRPQAMIGHSLGEYVAACVAGVFSLEEALALVAARGRMMQSLSRGAMLVVPLTESEVQPWLCESVSLAAINGPSQSVLSGPNETIEELAEHLLREGVSCRRLPTSHAFHSQMMDSMIEPFTELIKQTVRRAPQIPYISNLTGTWITEEAIQDPGYWAQHLRRTVRFADGLHEVFNKSERRLLEVGPGHTLSRLVRRHGDVTAGQVVLASLPVQEDSLTEDAFMLNTLGQLWLTGVPVDWTGFHAQERRHRLPLPSYPFERRRYWIEANERHEETARQRRSDIATGEAAGARPLSASPPSHQHRRPARIRTPFVAPSTELERSVARIWQEILGIEPVGVDDNFFDLGGDSLIATQAMAQLKRELGMEIPVVSLYEGVTIRFLIDLVRAGQNKDVVAQPSNGSGETREERVLRRKNYQQQQRLKKQAASG
jgi:acyl transferase domain-containing protein